MGYCYVTELHAYDFVIKDFVIKRGIICAGPCIILVKQCYEIYKELLKLNKKTEFN